MDDSDSDDSFDNSDTISMQEVNLLELSTPQLTELKFQLEQV